MSAENTNCRDCVVCSIVWALCFIVLAFIWNSSGTKTCLFSILPLIFFTDLAIWISFSLVRLPCGFTEWVCYPFWPFKYHGFSMRWGVIIRFLEIGTLLISGHWLWETVKALF